MLSNQQPKPFEFSIHRAYGELLNVCVFVLNAFAENQENSTNHNDVKHDPYRELLYGVMEDLAHFGKADTSEIYTEEKHRQNINFFSNMLSTINTEYNHLSAWVANYTQEEKKIIKQYIANQ